MPIRGRAVNLPLGANGCSLGCLDRDPPIRRDRTTLYPAAQTREVDSNHTLEKLKLLDQARIVEQAVIDQLMRALGPVQPRQEIHLYGTRGVLPVDPAVGDLDL